MTFPLGATPGTYIFTLTVVAYNTTDSLSAAYEVTSVRRTTGAAAIAFGVSDIFTDEEGAMSGVLVGITSSANNFVVQLNGLAGKTINWKLVGTYTFTS